MVVQWQKGKSVHLLIWCKVQHKNHKNKHFTFHLMKSNLSDLAENGLIHLRCPEVIIRYQMACLPSRVL